MDGSVERSSPAFDLTPARTESVWATMNQRLSREAKELVASLGILKVSVEAMNRS